jgi:mono/diheme cytochrome c family protein
MKNDKVFTGALLTAAAMSLAACGQSEPSAGDRVKRGEYLVTVMSCADCHTPGALLGKPDMTKALGGSEVGFFIPELGYFYGPNLTADKDTGLGGWSEDQIVAALRTGTRPDGRKLVPIMPWMSFASLTDDDAHAIAAYLMSLAPIANKVPGPFGAGEPPTAPYQTVVFPQAATPAQPAAPTPTPPQ